MENTSIVKWLKQDMLLLLLLITKVYHDLDFFFGFLFTAQLFQFKSNEQLCVLSWKFKTPELPSFIWSQDSFTYKIHHLGPHQTAGNKHIYSSLWTSCPEFGFRKLGLPVVLTTPVNFKIVFHSGIWTAKRKVEPHLFL